MSCGLYTKAHVARWMGKRAQDIQAMIDRDGLPAVPMPSATRMDDRIPLHGLWHWCKQRSKGMAFMSVEELAREMEMCATSEGANPNAQELAKLTEISGLLSTFQQILATTQTRPAAIKEALKSCMLEWIDRAA